MLNGSKHFDAVKLLCFVLISKTGEITEQGQHRSVYWSSVRSSELKDWQHSKTFSYINGHYESEIVYENNHMKPTDNDLKENTRKTKNILPK